MFYARWKTPWEVVPVYAVDPTNNKFLVNDRGFFDWVDMSEFDPIL